ncbi:unnamed protein product [Meloidogyne enterolobii]|uniref:Uncharacterized protein n=1 Tax=Meloidogyne enterolobii TaxID=390850 RepID=A0ACB0ZG41_MELEN
MKKISAAAILILKSAPQSAGFEVLGKLSFDISDLEKYRRLEI